MVNEEHVNAIEAIVDAIQNHVPCQISDISDDILARKILKAIEPFMNTRHAAPVEGLETVAYQYQIPRNGHWDNLPSDWTADECKAYDKKETRELVTRSQAEAIIAALQSDVTGSASVIEHLTQRAERAEADNAELTARVKVLKELEKYTVPIHADGSHVFIDGTGDVELDHGGKMRTQIKALETQLAAARKALTDIQCMDWGCLAVSDVFDEINEIVERAALEDRP